MRITNKKGRLFIVIVYSILHEIWRLKKPISCLHMRARIHFPEINLETLLLNECHATFPARIVTHSSAGNLHIFLAVDFIWEHSEPLEFRDD